MNAESLQAIELQTHRGPGAAVIILHGLGADGHDFVPVVRELEALGAPPARYVFPHAPMMPVTINGGHVMRAWYDIMANDLTRREDETGVRASQRLVEALIADQVARGIERSRIVLAGFSQGGAITLQTGLRQREPLAALIALSSYLPLAASLTAEAAPESRGVPIFMAHGTSDTVIPYARAVASREALIAAGYDVSWHEYPMPHSVSEAEIRDIAQFLQRVLGPSSSR